MADHDDCKKCEHQLLSLGVQSAHAHPIFRNLEAFWCSRCGATATIEYRARTVLIYAPSDEGPQEISRHFGTIGSIHG